MVGRFADEQQRNQLHFGNDRRPDWGRHDAAPSPEISHLSSRNSASLASILSKAKAFSHSGMRVSTSCGLRRFTRVTSAERRPGMMAGSVSWHIQGGTGLFQSQQDSLLLRLRSPTQVKSSEYHCGLIFVTN